jgi:hypothetical protein
MCESSQQQTLSVRTGEGLRRKLECARDLEIARTGQDVSISEVAKQSGLGTRVRRSPYALLDRARTYAVRLRTTAIGLGSMRIPSRIL